MVTNPFSYPMLFITVLLIVGGLVALTAIKVVPQSEEWTLERFGKFTRILQPGLHIIVPLVDRIGRRISLREFVLDIPPQEIITKDNALVKVDGVVFYRIFDSEKAAYKVAHLDIAITQLTMTNIRTVMGDMELNSMLSNREEINGKLLHVIDEATDPWGTKVIRIEIKDITPPAKLKEAMLQLTTADRERTAKILKAEGSREAHILEAEGKKLAAILEAEGTKKKIILEAEASKERAYMEAQVRERKAQALAASLEVTDAALKKGEGMSARYFLTEEYIHSLQELGNGKNSKTILMPFEATKAVGNMTFLGEFARDFLKKSDKADKSKDSHSKSKK